MSRGLWWLLRHQSVYTNVFLLFVIWGKKKNVQKRSWGCLMPPVFLIFLWLSFDSLFLSPLLFLFFVFLLLFFLSAQSSCPLCLPFCLLTAPKGGWGCLMSLSCLESQGCHFIPLSYLLSCFFLPSPLALDLCLAFFLLMVPSSDCFSRKFSNFFSLWVKLF